MCFYTSSLFLYTHKYIRFQEHDFLLYCFKTKQNKFLQETSLNKWIYCIFLLFTKALSDCICFFHDSNTLKDLFLNLEVSFFCSVCVCVLFFKAVFVTQSKSIRYTHNNIRAPIIEYFQRKFLLLFFFILD